jgi:epoxyqueuosine reductase QueG
LNLATIFGLEYSIEYIVYQVQHLKFQKERIFFMMQSTELSVWLEKIITEFVENSPENRLGIKPEEKAVGNPLVGFSIGNDPLYEAFKEYVGPFHWTPWEIFSETFPEIGVRPEALTVISWVLPKTEATKADNRKHADYPSERWTRARNFGEEINIALRKHVVSALQRKGYKSVAPQLSPDWSRKKSDRYRIASNWSERHAAYASGLGTFGLCDGLITPIGKAMRTGSVVAHIQLSATPRPYTDHHEYCLFFTQGICGKCIKRCPVGAITEAGHDKIKCVKHLRIAIGDYVKFHYGFKKGGCGMCQTKVPCESRIPTEQDVESYENDELE